MTAALIVRARRLLPPALVLVAAVVAWYLVSTVLLTEQRKFMLPPPHEILRASFGDSYYRAELLTALGRTTVVALTGLGLACLVGVLAAIAMSRARWVERSFYPYAVVLQTIPILALVPLFGFWFGFGFASRVLVCVLIALFPIVANTLFGLRSVRPEHRDLFALHEVGGLTRLVKLELPAALPAFFAGLRIAAGLSAIGAVVGDFFFKQGDPGIGLLIEIYRQQLQYEVMFGAVLLSSLLGLVVFWSFGFLAERIVGSWHEGWRQQ